MPDRPTTVLRIRSDGLDWVEAGSEIIALDRQTSVYLSANSSGALLWRFLLSGATRDDLTHLLSEHFAIDLKQAAGDVDAFLRQLDDAGLLAESV